MNRIFASCSKSRFSALSGSKRRSFETLEPRQLLAVDSLIISEILAINNNSLADADGDFSDWVEIYNPTDEIVSLQDWYLTDNPDNLTKWAFASRNITPGSYELIFTSGKDRAVRGENMHANFRLNNNGEYLALVNPDLEVVHEFTPEYPNQKSDFSYGIVQNNFELISGETKLDVIVPGDDSLGDAWQATDFVVDENSWHNIKPPIGFGVDLPDLSLPGFTVKDIRSSSSINTMEQADALVSGTNVLSETTLIGAPVIDFLDTGNAGNFEHDNPYPSGGGNHFVILATATLDVEAEGMFTFGIFNDDGSRMTIDGQTILEIDARKTPANELAAPIHLTAGTHSFEFLKFQSSRDASTELFVASGEHTAFNNSFSLLGESSGIGLKVFAVTGKSNLSDISADMQGVNSSAYLRSPFEVGENDTIDNLSLQIQYSDGFVAYLNGTEVARRNAPETLGWDSAATAERTVEQALLSESIDLSEHIGVLQTGDNVLAIQALSLGVNDDTLLMSPKLVGSGLILSRPQFFETPTPESANRSPFAGFLDAPDISVDSGFHETRFNVEITSEVPDGIIRYTLDSSLPTLTNGFNYSGPIPIGSSTVLRAVVFKANHKPSDATVRTYVFLDDVLTQDGAGLPNEWGVYVNAANGHAVGETRFANYEVDQAIANDPRYRDTIRDDLKSIPVLSLVIDPEDLWDPDTGIYTHTMSEGIAWERPVSAELIGTDGEIEFQVNAGVRIHGGWGRRPSQNSKHSFRLLFRDDYGPTELEYPWFGEDVAASFNTVVLRAGFNDSWATGGSSATTYLQDPWSAATQNDMGGYGPHSSWVHLYLNGLYWGVYNPVERPNAGFAASYFGGDKDEYDAIVTNSFTDGNNEAWNDLFAAVRQEPMDYEAVQELIDIPNFIDYLLMNQFGGNWDWPQNNWYASHRRGPGGKWYFHSWDAEGNLDRGIGENRVSQTNGPPGELYAELREVEEFRMLMADTIQKYYFNDGILTPEKNIARLDRIAAEIDRAIVGESLRWGDGRDNQTTSRTRDDWIGQLDSLRNSFFPQRNEAVLNQYRNVGIYPVIDTPFFTIGRDLQHGGQISPDDFIKIQGGGGRGATLYYTLDGSDPWLPGGTPNPDALIYTEPFQITESSVIKARVFQSRIWTALLEAQFLINTPATAENLAVTEIHYNPDDPSQEEIDAGFTNNDDFEFIELQNISDGTIDLAGVRFLEGIEFDFTESNKISLAPGEYVVVAKSLAAFEARYGTEIPVAGEFTSGRLSNDGEMIQLVDTNDAVIQEFSFNDNAQWPAEADGLGSSLVVIDTSGDYNDGANWRSSVELGGSPGAEGAEPVDLPPSILDVRTSSSRWSEEFANKIADLGAVGEGYSILNGVEDPLASLPWLNLDMIHVVFSEDVTIAESDLSLFGVNVADYVSELGFQQGNFSYDDTTFTATWSLAGSIGNDKVLVGLGENISDALGNSLAGDAQFQFPVLSGDATRSGDVDMLDVQAVRDTMLLRLADPGYSVMTDFDGNGAVDIRDVQILRSNMLTALPTDDPPAGLAIEAAELSGRFDTLSNEESSTETTTGERTDDRETALQFAAQRRIASDILLAQEQTLLSLQSDEDWSVDPEDGKEESLSWEDLVDQTLDET